MVDCSTCVGFGVGLAVGDGVGVAAGADGAGFALDPLHPVLSPMHKAKAALRLAVRVKKPTFVENLREP